MANMGYPDVQLQVLLLGFIGRKNIPEGLKLFLISLPVLQQPLVYPYCNTSLHQ